MRSHITRGDEQAYTTAGELNQRGEEGHENDEAGIGNVRTNLLETPRERTRKLRVEVV